MDARKPTPRRVNERSVETSFQQAKEVDLCHLLFTKEALRRKQDAAYTTFYGKPTLTRIFPHYLTPLRPRDRSEQRKSISGRGQLCPSIARDSSPRSYTKYTRACRTPKFQSSSLLVERLPGAMRELDIGPAFLTFRIPTKR